MLRNKFLLLSLFLGLAVLPVYSEGILSEIEYPKPPAFRVGISEYPERQYIQAEETKTYQVEQANKLSDNQKETDLANYTYADLDLKRMSREISKELEFDGQEMLSDLSLLWQGAAMQSETINFALYKLANPDADKPDEKSIKKVLTTIASMSTLVGAGIGNPVLAGTSLISGNVLGIMTQDTKALNYKYTRVNDADMIILIRKVEDLQQKTVDLYYDYISAKKQVDLIADMVNERKEKFNYAQTNNAPRELVLITDAYYRTALDKLRNARSEFFSKRAALEQFVGNETLLQFEDELAARENGEKMAQQVTSQQAEEYSQTIQNIDQYTDNLPLSVEPDFLKAPVEQVPMISLENYEQNKLNIAENKNVNANKVTGLSSNLSDEDVTQEGNNKKVKKQKNKEKASIQNDEKSEKKKVENSNKKKKINDKLIFIRNGESAQADRENSNQSQPVQSQEQQVQTQQQSQSATPIQPTKQPRKQYGTIDTSNLLPLDEIKPPQINGGYSIHNDYIQGDYYGDNALPL